MKIFIVASKHFYGRVEKIKKDLEKNGHVVTVPVSLEDPFAEEKVKKLGKDEHIDWLKNVLFEAAKRVSDNDALFVLNFEKKGKANYIGGAVFLEIYEAWRLDKKIFLYNPIPKNILEDEIQGFNPLVIKGDLSLIK